MTQAPAWLDPLVTAVRAAPVEELSRHVPPYGGGRESAVLIALRDDAHGPAVLLIERAAGIRRHAGQVGFPGGVIDPGDTGPVATALREAGEEVGLDPSSVEVLATLPQLFVPPTRFLVTPILGWWVRPHPVGVVDINEVARVAIVSFAELAAPANRFRVQHPSGYIGPAFEAGGLFIWGFTGGVLDALLRLGGWEQPWDAQQIRPLPPVLGGGTAALGTVPP